MDSKSADTMVSSGDGLINKSNLSKLVVMDRNRATLEVVMVRIARVISNPSVSKFFECFVASFLNPCHSLGINDTHIELLFLDESLVKVLELSLINVWLVFWIKLLLHKLFNIEILKE